MNRREHIIDAARLLTQNRGVVPSLNDVAAAAGVSKGGLVHHFPTRAALVQGLAEWAIAQVDDAMTTAASEGRAAEAWLQLSVPTGDDIALFRALALAHRAIEAPGDPVAQFARVAIDRWEALMVRQTGNPMLARIIRLVGDGLAANIVAGIETAPKRADLDALIDALMYGMALQRGGGDA